MKNTLLAIAAGSLLLAGCATGVPTDGGCCPTKCAPACAPAPCCKGVASCRSKCDTCNSCKG